MQIMDIVLWVFKMKIIEYENLDSTQFEAKRLVDQNKIQEDTVIVTQNQTNGIGTHGRKWISQKDETITFTLVMKPDCKIELLDNITINIAKCIIDTLKEMYNIDLYIKKPNDIMFNNKKIGGILTESKIQDGIVKYIFIGIGLNTNQTEFAPELKDIATSIKKEFNIQIDNQLVIIQVLIAALYKNWGDKQLHK